MRTAPSRPVILIPARMASTRLPGKPLVDILGLPMIVRVCQRAKAAQLGPVLVACAEPEILEAVKKAGCDAVLTNPAHPSGSDRIYEALTKFDTSGEYDAVLNVQGDLPTVEPDTIKAVYRSLMNPDVDISTAIAPIEHEADRNNPAIVKAVVEIRPGGTSGRALYFSRNVVPANEGPHWHHIGLYGYRRDALERFVKLPPAELELREKLEQLRALSAGMRMEAAVVNEVPLGVDTPAELALAREMIAANPSAY